MGKGGLRVGAYMSLIPRVRNTRGGKAATLSRVPGKCVPFLRSTSRRHHSISLEQDCQRRGIQRELPWFAQ